MLTQGDHSGIPYLFTWRHKKAERAAKAARSGCVPETMAASPSRLSPTGFQKEAADLYGEGTPRIPQSEQKHIDRMDRMTGHDR